MGTGQRNVNLTQDPGCAQTRGGPCADEDDELASGGRRLRVGYIGNGVSLTTVQGGTLRNNLVLLDSKGKVIGSTARFAITGQLADGPAALLSTNAVSFGQRRQARASARSR